MIIKCGRNVFMKKVIVYYPFPILNTKSASYVRPLKMITAFKQISRDLNFEVIDIYGDSKERKKRLDELMQSTNPNDILFCYMENNTTPFWLTDRDHLPRNLVFDHRFFRYLQKHDIPIGLFYRDVYWKFDAFNNSMTSKILKNIHKVELKVFKKIATKIYLPTKSMNQYVNIQPKQLGVLPPGGERQEIEKVQSSSLVTMIYVGGISERYGTDRLLTALDKMNKEGKRVHLILVCREDGFASFQQQFMFNYDRDDLEIHHKSGHELKELYARADFGVIPVRKNTYNDFAIPVKLFEYLSYQLPILATNCNEMEKVINEAKIGYIVEDSVDGLIQGFEHFLNNNVQLIYENHIQHALSHQHQWIHRAKTVYDDLSNVGE